jgi:hypothetical protein
MQRITLIPILLAVAVACAPPPAPPPESRAQINSELARSQPAPTPTGYTDPRVGGSVPLFGQNAGGNAGGGGIGGDTQMPQGVNTTAPAERVLNNDLRRTF